MLETIIAQIDKEMQRLDGEIKNLSNEIKPLKLELQKAISAEDVDRKRELQSALKDLFSRKDKLKADWYLMNAEKMEKQRQEKGKSP